MPVYNAAAYVDQAVTSILKQSLSDWELIIFDDGSTDDSLARLQSFSDPRIRVIAGETNAGLVTARNQLLAAAQGEYIAWLDADDFSTPDRLATQLQFLKANPQTVLCGAWAQPFEEPGGRRLRIWKYPQNDAENRARLLFDDPFATSTILMRRAALIEHGLRFDPEFPLAEDYDLWERLAQHGELANLQRVITHYRIHAAQTSAGSGVEKIKPGETSAVARIQERQLKRFGIQATAEEQALHLRCGLNQYEPTEQFREAARRWLHKLLEHNESTGYYEPHAFRTVIADRWWRVCYAGWRQGLAAFREYRRSELSRLKHCRHPAALPFALRAVLASLRLV